MKWLIGFGYTRQCRLYKGAVGALSEGKGGNRLVLLGDLLYTDHGTHFRGNMIPRL